MANVFVKCFLCVSVIVSLTGCATYQVSKMGKYTSSQVPERAVIFPDGQVVVDFSERRIAERVFGSGYYKDKLYYKRIYFTPGRFLDPQELSRDPTSRNVGKGLSLYTNSANADEEKGSWRPLASDDLPPIPQMEPVLTDFSSYCRRPFPVLNKQQLQFETCDTRNGMAQYSLVKARVDYNRREWWSYPAQLLYIPTIAIDIVTAPIQLIALGVVPMTTVIRSGDLVSIVMEISICPDVCKPQPKTAAVTFRSSGDMRIQYPSKASFLMIFLVLLLIAAWAAPNSEGADPKKKPARHAAKANAMKPTNNYPIVLVDNPQYSKFERNYKWGLLESWNKKVLIEPHYDDLRAFDAIHNIVTVKLHGKWGCIEYPTGKIILPLKYDDIGSYGSELRKVKRNGKWGYVNIQTGEDVIPLKYDQIGPLFPRTPNPEYAERTVEFKKALGRYSQVLFVNAKMPAVEFNDQWGYIDRTGKEVIALKYQRASDFRDGVAVVVENYMPGLIDERGREVVPPGKYAEIRDSSEGLSVIGVKSPEDPGKNVFGYVDNKAGTVIVEPKYENALGFRGGRALVMVEGEKFYIDKTGKELHLPHYRELSDFSEGRAAVCSFDSKTAMLKWGYIDTTGKEVIAPRFDEAGPFDKGLANVKANGRSFYIDKAGKPVACAYCLTRVRLKGKLGYVDSTGREILPIQYEELPVALFPRFHRFKLRGKYGLLDGSANIVAPPKYDELPEEARYEAVRFKLNGKYGYMRAGNEVVPAKYDELPEVLSALLLKFSRYKLNGKYGYLNGEGIEVTPAKYDEAPEELGGPFTWCTENESGEEKGTIRVSANGKYGYLSRINAKEIYPPVCEDGPLFLNKTRTKVKCGGKWGYIDPQGRKVGSFEYEEDPCSIEKTKGDHYLFGPGADLKAQPHMASAGIAHLPAGSKIEVLEKTDKELTIGDVTDKWYEARYQDKRGYVWGGSLADAACPVSVKGKNGVVVIRNRAKHSDHCYHPKFEMQLAIGGNVVDSRKDSTLSNLTAKVISMKYESYEGFSTPLNLLVMTVGETHGQDQGSLSVESGIYYYLDEGKLAEVLYLKMAVEGEGRKVTSTVRMPDKGSKKDAVIVRTRVSLPNREDSFSETSYHWDCYKKSFRQF